MPTWCPADLEIGVNRRSPSSERPRQAARRHACRRPNRSA
jgi:hypothetical protein